MASGHRKWCYYYSTTPAMGLAIPPISRPGGFTGGFTGIDWIGLPRSQQPQVPYAAVAVQRAGGHLAAS
jgi:hypothetical protein